MKFMTVAEVAATLRVSQDYVRKLCGSGQLRAKKVGQEWRIRETAFEAFMDDTDKTAPTRPGRALTKKQRRAVDQRRGQFA